MRDIGRLFLENQLFVLRLTLRSVNGINKDVSGTTLLPTTVSTYPMD